MQKFFLNKQINAISTLLTHMSVRHTPVFCRNGWTYHQTFFIFGSRTILPYQMLWQYSDWCPPNRDVEYRWSIQDLHFRPCRFMSEMIYDRTVVRRYRPTIWNANRNSYAISNGAISNDLEWFSEIFNDIVNSPPPLRKIKSRHHACRIGIPKSRPLF